MITIVPLRPIITLALAVTCFTALPRTTEGRELPRALSSFQNGEVGQVIFECSQKKFKVENGWLSAPKVYVSSGSTWSEIESAQILDTAIDSLTYTSEIKLSYYGDIRNAIEPSRSRILDSQIIDGSSMELVKPSFQVWPKRSNRKHEVSGTLDLLEGKMNFINEEEIEGIVQKSLPTFPFDESFSCSKNQLFRFLDGFDQSGNFRRFKYEDKLECAKRAANLVGTLKENKTIFHDEISKLRSSFSFCEADVHKKFAKFRLSEPTSYQQRKDALKELNENYRKCTEAASTDFKKFEEKINSFINRYNNIALRTSSVTFPARSIENTEICNLISYN